MGVRAIDRALTTAAVEKRTGVPRTTIYFYIREGLLPRPHKTASGRSLYSENHVAILEKISELKEFGYSLSEIEVALESDVARVGGEGVDLAKQETERIRNAILRVATEEFATVGYKRTRVATIIRKLGITPYVFYRHFPSKLELLVACFNTFIKWNIAYTYPRVMALSDPAERQLVRAMAHSRVRQLGDELAAVLHLEAPADRADPYRLTESWQLVISQSIAELESLRSPGSTPLPIPLELLANSFIGAHRQASARASWDDEFDLADVLRTHLFLSLAVFAALRGEIDLTALLARYEEFIQDLVAQQPDLPPPQED